MLPSFRTQQAFINLDDGQQIPLDLKVFLLTEKCRDSVFESELYYLREQDDSRFFAEAESRDEFPATEFNLQTIQLIKEKCVGVEFHLHCGNTEYRFDISEERLRFGLIFTQRKVEKLKWPALPLTNKNQGIEYCWKSYFKISLRSNISGGSMSIL
jgi:hypothetical protein